MADTQVKSAEVQGMHLSGVDGDKLGSVREMFVDLTSGAIIFLIVEGASLLGGSGKYHPIPWSAVRFDPVARSFQLEMTKDAFKGSPSYDRDQLANSSYGWDEQAIRYFTPNQT